MLISSSCLMVMKFSLQFGNSIIQIFKLTPLQFRETPNKSYKAGTKHAFDWVIAQTYGVGLGYYSKMASDPLAVPTWCRPRLLFQNTSGSVALPTWRRAQALSFGSNNYEHCLHLSEWVSASPRKKHFSTFRVSKSLKSITLITIDILPSIFQINIPSFGCVK